MKKTTGLLWFSLLLGGMLPLAGCDEALEVERKNPNVEIIPSLDRIIVVMDKQSGERRGSEPVTLSITDEAGSEVISELGEFTTDQSGELELALETGYYRAEFAYTPGMGLDVSFDFEVTENKIYYYMLIEDPEGDFYPHDVTITLNDPKSGGAMAGHDFTLYVKGRGDAYNLVGEYTTDANGQVVIEDELYKGAYRIVTAYYPGTRKAAHSSLDFLVGKNESNAPTFDIEPVLFVENFSWWKPEWNLINTSGVLQSTKVATWYSYNSDGTLATTAPGTGQRCDMPRASDVNSATGDLKEEYTERRAALDETGLTFTATFGVLLYLGDDKNPACWSMYLGSGAITGGIKTAPSTGAPATFDMKVSLLANPGHKYVSNAWKFESSNDAIISANVDVAITIEGGGYFLDGQNQVTRIVLDNPSVYDNPLMAPDYWNPLEAIVHNATPATTLLFTHADLTARGRFLIANIRLVEVY